MSIRCLLLSVLTISETFAGPVIFSNIGPGFPGDSHNGWNPADNFDGMTFTATGSGALSQIEMDLFNHPVGTTLTTGLYADSGGEPGTLLETYNIALNNFDHEITIPSLVNPVLSAGSPYWFVIDDAISHDVVWIGNDESILAGDWGGATLTGMTDFGPGSNHSPGIELDAIAAAPEPSTALLAAIGALAFAAFKYRRSR